MPTYARRRNHLALVRESPPVWNGPSEAASTPSTPDRTENVDPTENADPLNYLLPF